ncbi:MAG: hypothetical protein ACTHJ8_20270 [Mucilaginibacter sp.]
MEEVADANRTGLGINIEVEYLGNYLDQQTFSQDLNALLSKYNLQETADTLLYIALYENERAWAVYENAHRKYESLKLAKELAQLLLAFKQTAENKLFKLKLETFTATTKVTFPNLIAWIGQMIEKGLSNADFTLPQLGEGVFHLLADQEKGIKVGEPIDYTVIQQMALQRIRAPRMLEKKLLAAFLYNTWVYLDQETELISAEGRHFSDAQMNFLFDIAEMLGWLDRNRIDAPPKDYLYSLFANHLK